MPRSLSQAGVGAAPVYAKADHCIGQPFYVLSATARTNRFNTEEVVFRLRLRDGVYDADGIHHKTVHVSLTNSGGQRADMVNYFKTNNDPLGPLVFHEIPSRNGNSFYQMVDAMPHEIEGRLETVPVLPARKERQEEPEEGELEDLPF